MSTMSPACEVAWRKYYNDHPCLPSVSCARKAFEACWEARGKQCDDTIENLQDTILCAKASMRLLLKKGVVSPTVYKALIKTMTP